MDFWCPQEHGGERQILDLSEMISLVTDELHQAEREIAQHRADRHETPVMQFSISQLRGCAEKADLGHLRGSRRKLNPWP